MVPTSSAENKSQATRDVICTHRSPDRLGGVFEKNRWSKK